MPRWAPFEPYFWSLVKKGQGCWIWTGGKDGKGYGRVWKDGKRQGAHRVAYELTHGPIKDGKYACHHCDNKICVNPDHIFIGTQKDNMQDWARKGKNRLVNDRSLWSNGKHMIDNKKLSKKFSELRKKEWAEGRRVAIRDEKGRIMGTRMVSK